MQEQSSSVSALPEKLSFEHGSSSSDAGLDCQVRNNMQASDHNERQGEDTRSRDPLNLEESPTESSNAVPTDSVDVNEQRNRTSNEKRPSSGSSSGGSDSDYTTCCSSDGRHVSCKRKALEVQAEQSSEAGSSNQSSTPVSATNAGMPAPVPNNPALDNGPEQENSTGRPGVGGADSSNSTRSLESRLRRHFRLRFAGSDEQDTVHSISSSRNANFGYSDVPSSQHSSRLVLMNRLLESNPTPPRLNIASLSRTSGSSSPLHDEEPTSSDTLPEHPMFVHASDVGGSSEQPTNSNLAGGSNINIGNAPSITRANSSSSSPSPAWSSRSDIYRRRLSEIIERSLLSAAGTESGVRSSSSAVRSDSSGSSNTRLASLEGQLDDVFGITHPVQSLAADNVARSRAISEQMRRALHLMRREEGFRFEDMAMHDHHPIFFEMAGVHDQHRDMRLDVDNMSYEELLALEDRIGNVCTGLNEETITTHLKRRKYAYVADTEPCCICREEYDEGEDVGSLECGHDFHNECIKQWLLIKNLCPICKTTGLSST